MIHEHTSPLPGPSPRGHDLPSLLLVDDEKVFADALAFRLQARGIAAEAVYRGDAALAALDQASVEIVLLDLNMPGMHGLDVLTLLKEKRPDVEVILLTGEADLAVAARGMRRGAGDYLLKPVDFADLLQSIEKAGQRARAHRERLRAAEAGKLMALGALAAGVGHELNNPLQIILQRSEWLQELAEDAADGSPDYAEMVKTAAVIQEQAGRAGAITARLLDLVHRSRSGTATTRLGELAAKVRDRLQARATSMGSTIVMDIAPDIPVLPCSPAELEPVLAHLLTNALDATEVRPDKGGSSASPDRPILLSATRQKTSVLIRVADSGEGVAPEIARHIFEPFFSTRPVGKGTGLGLTVCHSIITALRGSIRFHPATDSPRGTVFVIELPVASPDERETDGSHV